MNPNGSGTIRLFHGSPERDFTPTFGLGRDPGAPVPGLVADWTGQFYAWAQWQSGLSSRELLERLPLGTILDAYPGLHDLSLPLAVERCLPAS